MFDIGFWELLLVFIVALVVIGPERLPQVARVLGLWVGKARRFIWSAKEELRSEIYNAEIQEKLKTDAGLNEVKEQMQKVEKDLSQTDTPLNHDKQRTQSS